MDSVAQYEIGLVVQIKPDQRGVWIVQIDGLTTSMSLDLQPVQIIIRLNRAGNGGGLRGTIQMPAFNLSTPIHCNSNAHALFRAWLIRESGTNPAE